VSNTAGNPGNLLFSVLVCEFARWLLILVTILYFGVCQTLSVQNIFW